ncbi:hypothetical protein HC761_01975 [bacterium]|nr:hypothetical protein [bacterium]
MLTQQLNRPDAAKPRVEVLSIYALRESDMDQAHAQCRSSNCYWVDLFDFSQQRMMRAVVDVVQASVISWRGQVGTMPEISKRLERLAVEIARTAPEVSEALGGVAPQSSDAIMASTKTALNGTRCERSQHLCVAPTFVQGNIAIWAIVDLSALRLVGVQWTNHGHDGPLPASVPTEQSLADAVIMQRYCERNTTLERAGWRLDYMLTASDGLQISAVQFQGQKMLRSAKLVDWHVNYSKRDGFGYADAVGCPNFSSAAVIPFAPPTVQDIRAQDQVIGFRLQQEFRSLGWPGPCNYSYRQSYEFYADGRFRPSATSIGAGCGDDATYRPILRLEPEGSDWRLQALQAEAAADAGQSATQFADVTSERWFAPDQSVAASGARFRLQRANGGFDLVPGRGQFADSRGDFEYVYVTAPAKAGQDEGASELPTLGSCCNEDHRQGPETFINEPPEPLDQGLVLWYVPQLKNDLRAGQQYCWAKPTLRDGALSQDVFPCEAGPMFVPIAANAANAASVEQRP